MKIFRNETDHLLYICVLFSFISTVYAFRPLRSDRHIAHRGWIPRSVQRSSFNVVKPVRGLSPLDPSSYSRPELAIITHISIFLTVDFKKQVLCGVATLNFYVIEEVNELFLDINCLKIESVETDEGLVLQYDTSGKYPVDRSKLTIGSKLTIKLPNKYCSGDKIKINVKYSTDPAASALTWLKPAKTSGKKLPYVFSQCSPIHARSILPCQDTPTVRFTYDAVIKAPEEFTVVMSAIKGAVKENKSTFHQPVPIPSSLLAIAVGALESRTIGPRSKVWSEKEDVDRCATEFSDVEKYLHAAEKLCGPYDWTVYDILVLPPSFSHGAMENPCLTFVSPTVVVGDKSLVSVIIHEIMHSWTGNAVSIKNFEHFWLNEGFAVFLERKVSASLINDTVKSKQSRDFSSLLGLQELTDTVNGMGSKHQFTKLVLDLDGVHPADAFTRIPYEKGSLFLRYVEDLLGGPKRFDKFIRRYVRQFSMQSIDTNEFKAFVLKRFRKNGKVKEIDWDTWLYGTGMPHIIPDYDRTLTRPVVTLVATMDVDNYTFSFADVQNFSVGQMIYMLQLLIEKPPMPVHKLNCLGTAYDVEASENKEIMSRWLRLCIRSKDESKLQQIFSFLNSVGRLSYVRSLYKELYEWEHVRNQAIRNFLKNEQYMSHITAYNVRKDLHLS